MEKRFHSNSSSLVLNHLPGIFNMIHILNMMVYGFVASQPAFFISALSSLQKSIRFSPKRQFGKRSGKLLLLRLRNLYYMTLVTCLLFVLFANSSTVNLLSILASITLLCLANQLYAINKRGMPISRIAYLRNLAVERIHLRNNPDKWYIYCHRYKITDILAFSSLLLAALFQ